jgi:TonB family protein
MRRLWLLAALAACGGAGAGAPPAPVETAAPTASAGGADPAAYSAVAATFARKRPLVSQCFGFAIENRELPESSRVRVRIALRVEPSGRPADVRIIESSQKSKTLEECVVTTVQKWTLPAPDKALDFIYTYEFSNT